MDHLIWGIDVRNEGLRALVLLNGFPVFMPAVVEEIIYATKLNPWIIEGDNELRVRLGRPEDGAALGGDAAFELEAYRTPHGELRGPDAGIVRYTWNRDEDEIQEDGMTDVLTQRFDVPAADAFGRWAWQDATPFDEGERVAIETLVGRCRQALVQRDADALVALLGVKFAETSHSLDVPADRFELLLREHLKPYFDAEGWQVDPIDYGVVSLIPACQGRIVLVMGRRGAPVLQGRVVVEEGEEPPNPFMMELAVSNLSGSWTVVR